MKSITILVAAVTLVICVSAESRQASAQPPRVLNADLDYEASGFVMPAKGQMPPGAIAGLTTSGPVQRAGYAGQAGPGYVPPMSGAPNNGMPMAATPINGYASGQATAQAMQAGGYSPQGSVQQVGFLQGGGSSCDSCGPGGCDSMCGDASYGQSYGGPTYGQQMQFGGCDGACGGICGGTGACGMGGGSVMSSGGVLGKIYGDSSCGGCGMDGCGSCGGLSKLRHICMFCRGEGCEACQMFRGRSLVGLLGALKPYSKAGKAAQRWYDISAEALFMGRSGSTGTGGVLTQRGAGPGGVAVLRGTDAINEDIEPGVRLSAALIFGVGGNIEATYFGGLEWDGSASVSSPATLIDNPSFDPLATTGPTSFPFTITGGADLYSFISEFGVTPADGFDDTDRSISQAVTNRATFNSGEINYRRRTVGPYNRFQGSWLAGMRHLRYNNRMGLDIVGLNNDGTDATLTDGTQRFFSSRDTIENSMFGGQIGGDLWYTMTPGIQLGVELKGMWMKNEARRNYSVSANSIAGGGPGTASDSYRVDNGTMALELSTQLVYRLSHSWSFRSAYYLVAIDEVASPELSGTFLKDVVDSPNSVGRPGMDFESLTLNGFTFGAEYLW
ncbi:MAG: hypothetical protein WBD31_12460 [Rubripirellula sp.]